MKYKYDAWGIQTPNGWIRPETIRERRGDCIYDFVDNITIATWEQLRREGWRCVRVKITAVSGDSANGG